MLFRIGSPCDGSCPDDECLTFRVELWGEAYDKCVCDLIPIKLFSIAAAPGDLVLVRLDAGDTAAEFDESNNVISSWIPYARGRKVRNYGSRRLAAGPQELAWNGCDDDGRAVPSGVYWYRVIADDEVATGAMALIR